uniref:hypothetical protein n=1 Tax=Roseivirga sp. TaxID=1964215 RepID=UPI004047883B
MKLVKYLTLIVVGVIFLIEYAAAQDRWSIIPKVGQYRERQLLIVESIDGIEIEPNRSSFDMEYLIGLELNYVVKPKISFSLSLENAFLFGSNYIIYDTQDPTQFGFIKKAIDAYFSNAFLSGYINYNLLILDDLRISINLGPEFLFSKLIGESKFNLGRQHQRLNEVAELMVTSFRPSIFHLRLGATAHYKRLQFSVVVKEDFNTSASNNITYEGNAYRFENDRRLVFFMIGYEVFKF